MSSFLNRISDWSEKVASDWCSKAIARAIDGSGQPSDSKQPESKVAFVLQQSRDVFTIVLPVCVAALVSGWLVLVMSPLSQHSWVWALITTLLSVAAASVSFAWCLELALKKFGGGKQKAEAHIDGEALEGKVPSTEPRPL